MTTKFEAAVSAIDSSLAELEVVINELESNAQVYLLPDRTTSRDSDECSPKEESSPHLDMMENLNSRVRLLTSQLRTINSRIQ